MTKTEKCMGKEEMFAYAHQLLEADAERAARQHVAECAACRTVVEEYQSLHSLLDEWKPAEPSVWFDARVRAALRAAPTPAWAGFGLRQILAMACTLVTVTLAALSLSRHADVQRDQELAATARPAANRVEEEITLYKDLPVLEDRDFDMIADFDVLSAVPRGQNGESELEN